MAFSQLEPFGSENDLVGFALVAATIANVYRKKGRKPYDIADFMPTIGPEKAQTVDEMLQIAQMMTIGLGGKDLRGEDK